MIFSLTHNGQVISLVSFALVSARSLVRSRLTDKEKLAEQKEKIKEHQKEMKHAQKNKDAERMQRSQEELMKATMEQMKHSMKPMLFTMLPFLLVFGWLRKNFGVAGTVATVYGYGFGWFAWYFLCSMVTGILLQKFLKIT